MSYEVTEGGKFRVTDENGKVIADNVPDIETARRINASDLTLKAVEEICTNPTDPEVLETAYAAYIKATSFRPHV